MLSHLLVYWRHFWRWKDPLEMSRLRLMRTMLPPKTEQSPKLMAINRGKPMLFLVTRRTGQEIRTVTGSRWNPGTLANRDR